MGFSKYTEYLVTGVIAFILFTYFLGIFSVQIKNINELESMENPYTKSYIYNEKGKNTYTRLDVEDYYFDESHMYMLPIVDVKIDRGWSNIKVNNYISYNTVTNNKFTVDDNHKIINSANSNTITVMSYIINRINLMNRNELLNTLSFSGSAIPSNMNVTVDGSNTENTIIFNTERSVVK